MVNAEEATPADVKDPVEEAHPEGLAHVVIPEHVHVVSNATSAFHDK